MNENLDPFSDWDAAYVLGALSMDDRALFERHLVGCVSCAAAVAELAGIPGILTKLDTQSAVALMSSPEAGHLYDSGYEFGLLQKLARVGTVQQRRVRAMRTVGMVAASAVLLVGGVAVGTALRPASNLVTNPLTNIAVGTPVVMSGVGANVMKADLWVTSKPWGTRIDWSSEYGSTWKSGDGPQSYDLIVTDTAGVETTVATWIAAGAGAKGLAAASKIPTANIRSIDIRATGSPMPLVSGNL